MINTDDRSKKTKQIATKDAEEPMIDSKTISELSDLANQLNSQSNTLNGRIAALNRQLAKSNFGLECWLASPLEDSGLRYDRSYTPPQKFEELTYLGYHNVHDVWQLAIREERITYEWHADEREEYPVTECDYTPLLDASPDTRLIAIEHFDELLEEMRRHVRRKLEAIDRADKLPKPASVL
jgi:hypothetical protein